MGQTEWRYLWSGDERDRALATTAEHGGAVHRRRHHRHDPQLRNGAVVPAFTATPLAIRARARARCRGLLVLPGDDPRGHLGVRRAGLSPSPHLLSAISAAMAG